MFLQYMALPVWLVPLLPYVRTLPGGDGWTLWYGLAMGFGTFASPLVGMLADRFLGGDRVLAICDLLAAALLALAFFVRSPVFLCILVLLALCAYMPTYSLMATIGLTHLSRTGFSRVRVFGTMGWSASGLISLLGAWLLGIDSFDTTSWIFATGSFLCALAGLCALAFVPPTAPMARGTPMSLSDALGLRAFALFRQRSFRSVMIPLFLAMLPFQWYNAYCADYLQETGFRYLTLTVNLGQIGEIGFMLLVPWILERLGFRKALTVALAVIVLRTLCFLLSFACGWRILDFGGVLVHGLIFGILVVGSQMYVAKVAPQELRGQAQGLANLITVGAGAIVSNALFGLILNMGAPGVRAWPLAYASAIALSVAVMLLLAFRRGGE